MEKKIEFDAQILPDNRARTLKLHVHGSEEDFLRLLKTDMFKPWGMVWVPVHVTLSPACPEQESKRPTIVCLCGSTCFLDAYKKASLEETMEGKIVLSIGCDMRTDKFFVGMSGDTEKKIKEQLDELHLRKIDLADEVLILNVNGYIGESTADEIAYAKKQGKQIRFLYDQTGMKKEET